MQVSRSSVYICRICLYRCIQSSQCRRLTQLTDQSTNSTDSNVTQTPHDKETPVRRVPLRELLSLRRKGSGTLKPEPLEKSPRDGQGNEHWPAQQKGNSDPPPSFEKHAQQIPAQNTERKSGENKTATTSQHSKYVRPKKFSMTFYQHKPSKPPVSKVQESTSLPEHSLDSTKHVDGSQRRTSEPAKSISSPESEKPYSEQIQSRRSRALEKSDSPLPSAPTTHLRYKPSHISRKAPPTKTGISPLARAYQVTQAISETKIHPGDPLFANAPFSGSAVREIITEDVETGDSDTHERIWSEDIQMKPVQPPEIRPVPTLEHGLDRVLFKYVLLRNLFKIVLGSHIFVIHDR